MTSPSSGFAAFGFLSSSIWSLESRLLSAPDGHIIMINMTRNTGRCRRNRVLHEDNSRIGVEVYSQEKNGLGDLLWISCDPRYAYTYILAASKVILVWRVPSGDCPNLVACWTMYFSFRPQSDAPQRLSNGLFNCSVDYYWRFQQHLDCNLKVECEDGRDETEHCPFSSPACQGWVALRGKCYKYISRETLDRHVQHGEKLKAAEYCASMNASLAVMKFNDLNRFQKIYRDRRKKSSPFSCTLIGITYGTLSVPNIYRRSLVAYDKTVIHHSLTASVYYNGSSRVQAMFRIKGQQMCLILCPPDTYVTVAYSAICEITAHVSDQKHNVVIRFGQKPFRFTKVNITFSRCPNGQMVHMLFFCYPHNACGGRSPHFCTFSIGMNNSTGNFLGKNQHMTSVPIFVCRDGVTRISYTLVCDFRHHCKDLSDEVFCQHPPCASSSFACSSGQCVSYLTRCDMMSDCLDDSDEFMCEGYRDSKKSIQHQKSPVLMKFQWKRFFRPKKISPDKKCPQTHYRCPGDYNDCLPVYTRCNGWYDCMDHEDEEACENMTCPGFYRCFNSTVCVHANHLCDDWPHCPQHDDELLCDMTCPVQCLCQGYAFFCSKIFSAHQFPHLRYLDARGSRMTPSDLSNNSYLVHLSLSSCSLHVLPVIAFLNLQFLDLSDNNLTAVSMTAFTRLNNLRILSLAKNPIDRIVSDTNPAALLSALRIVDLSHSKLTVFDSKILANMINLQRLNLSFSAIHTIHPSGFRHIPKLTHLYLAGNPIRMFSADIFKPLKILRTLSSQTYKLCCKELLPDHFEIITCDVPRNEISSCKDLLQSGAYRGSVWLISFLSLLGNVLCLVVRVCVLRTASTSGFHVFVTNLSIADLLMGVYVSIIGVADSIFRGKYLFFDESWKHSMACKVAGFLSLLSCEVSALTIWLITLDRFIVLHFPFSGAHFQRTSAVAASLIIWLVGLFLGLVPLLPVTSHWEFFGQTGICIPLPVTRQDFQGKIFSISVFIVFNFVLFVLIVTGQMFIFWSVQKNALNTDSTKVSRDLTIARRLISVAVTDFLCWFPIGLCGLLALADVPIPGEVNAAFAIFVLPLNSALNPFIYTFNMLMEKRKKSREAMLLQWLETHFDLL